jgi:hypothetical protein
MKRGNPKFLGRMNRRLRLAAAFALACVASGATLAGCDWIHYNFMNSIPFKGNPAHNPDVYVYLGVDGLSYHTVQAAMQKGAFAGSDWHLAKFITMFPGTSDASWTRIMHTPKLGGYEIEYYDPNKDEVINHGLLGLAKHVMPSFADFINFEFDYLKAFDYRANGYTSEANAYADTFASLGDTLDNFFYLLDGRVETATVFSSYIIEYDVMGHIKQSDDVLRALMLLADRIKKFQERHSERRIHFTILSDHGMDFIRVNNDRLMDLTDELPKVGINSVEHLAGHDPKKELFAIPINHTRVTYLAVHTHPDLIEEVAPRITMLPSVDLAVSKLKTPPSDPHAPNPLSWFAIWADGKQAAYFGFDPVTDQYYLPADQNYQRFDFNPTFDSGEDFKVMSDDDLFQALKDRTYPDIFYRARTSVSTVSTIYPADVMVSFRPTYAALGFSLPSTTVTSMGFHGSLEELGTLGTLLTNERTLPDAVRADTFLDLFPRMRDHMKALGVPMIDGDPNAGLNYK